MLNEGDLGEGKPLQEWLHDCIEKPGQGLWLVFYDPDGSLEVGLETVLFPLADDRNMSVEEQEALDERVNQQHSNFLNLDQLEDVVSNAKHQKTNPSMEELAKAARFYFERDAFIEFDHKPPMLIDGARVLYWAWSGDNPFGRLASADGEIVHEIFGLAVCRYESGSIYRFSCTANWGTEQDAQYQTVEQAMEQLPDQYCEVKAVWQQYK